MKSHLLLSALAFALILPACAGREWTEAVAPAERIRELEALNQALHQQIDTLETENRHIRAEGEKATAAAGSHNERLRARIEALEVQVQDLQGQRELALAAENKSQKLQQLVDALEAELRKQPSKGKPQAAIAKKPSQPRPPAMPAAQIPTAEASLQIKVLSGDGDPASAEAMSRKLSALGYAARPFGFAERADFEQPTVYFSPAFEAQAQRVAKELGPQTLRKPLTWHSSYGLIVVTGTRGAAPPAGRATP